jgi:hypothetical protein
MPTYPTTGKARNNTLFRGSCKIEVSQTGLTGSWIDVGLARSVVFNETIESAGIQADNAPEEEFGVSNQEVEIDFSGLEFNLAVMNLIRGGIDLLTASSAVASSVTDTFTSGSLVKGRIIYPSDQAQKSSQTSIQTVKGVRTSDNDTHTYTKPADWEVFVDAADRKGIYIKTTGSVGTSRKIKVHYHYTKVTKYKMTSGGLTDVSPRWWKLTNRQIVSGTVKERVFCVYSGSLVQGMNLAFKSSRDQDNVLEIPIKIKAVLDTSRTAGDQLFFIEDAASTDGLT